MKRFLISTLFLMTLGSAFATGLAPSESDATVQRSVIPTPEQIATLKATATTDYLPPAPPR